MSVNIYGKIKRYEILSTVTSNIDKYIDVNLYKKFPATCDGTIELYDGFFKLAIYYCFKKNASISHILGGFAFSQSVERYSRGVF